MSPVCGIFTSLLVSAALIFNGISLLLVFLLERGRNPVHNIYDMSVNKQTNKQVCAHKNQVYLHKLQMVKGELLFSSVEQVNVEVIMTNLKFGP